MDEDGYELTRQLRFVKRPYGPLGPTERSVKLILQQLWQLTYDGDVVGEEWRDVPTEDENESVG